MVIDSVSPIFKSLVWDVMIKSAVGKAIALLALSPTGFVANIVATLLIKFSDWLYPIFEKAIKVGEIKLSNEIHQRAYEKAQYKLKVIAIEKGIDSDEFKKQRDIEHNKLVDAIVYSI